MLRTHIIGTRIHCSTGLGLSSQRLDRQPRQCLDMSHADRLFGFETGLLFTEASAGRSPGGGPKEGPFLGLNGDFMMKSRPNAFSLEPHSSTCIMVLFR